MQLGSIKTKLLGVFLALLLQISSIVAQIAGVSSEETSCAAESLAARARDLAALVAGFELERSGNAATPPALPRSGSAQCSPSRRPPALHSESSFGNWQS